MCGYTAKQLRSAYGYSAKYSGQGQKIAVIELGLTPYMFRTLQDYARANDITAPVATRYEEMSIGRGNDCGTPFGVEEQTDVEASYMMSPGATHLVVGGDTCDDGDYGLQALFDADTAVLDGGGGEPLASIVSNSWEGFSENQPAFISDVEHALLVRAAAEGVGMYFATGDNSGVLTPASDPYAIAVGGTSLGIGRQNRRVMETGWSTGLFTDTGDGWAFQGGDGAGGGGPSLLWAQPAYQRGVVPPSLARAPGDRGGLVRTIPDVSADADPFTGMAVGMLTLSASGQPAGYSQTPVGGTSLATPIVASLVADAQQGMARSFGFIDPVLYRLARTRAFRDVYPVTPRTASQYRAMACNVAACGVLSLANFDDQSDSMPGYTGQVTRAGYDTMTGIGTPNGPYFQALIREPGKVTPHSSRPLPAAAGFRPAERRGTRHPRGSGPAGHGCAWVTGGRALAGPGSRLRPGSGCPARRPCRTWSRRSRPPPRRSSSSRPTRMPFPRPAAPPRPPRPG